jgi:hypothetical protein
MIVFTNLHWLIQKLGKLLPIARKPMVEKNASEIFRLDWTALTRTKGLKGDITMVDMDMVILMLITFTNFGHY